MIPNPMYLDRTNKVIIFCRVCRRYIHRRGKGGHERGSEHKENFELLVEMGFLLLEKADGKG